MQCYNLSIASRFFLAFYGQKSQNIKFSNKNHKKYYTNKIVDFLLFSCCAVLSLLSVTLLSKPTKLLLVKRFFLTCNFLTYTFLLYFLTLVIFNGALLFHTVYFDTVFLRKFSLKQHICSFKFKLLYIIYRLPVDLANNL